MRASLAVARLHPTPFPAAMTELNKVDRDWLSRDGAAKLSSQENAPIQAVIAIFGVSRVGLM